MSFKNIGNLKTRNYSNYVISQYLEQHLCHKQFPLRYLQVLVKHNIILNLRTINSENLKND